jgi:hypothetical protein
MELVLLSAGSNYNQIQMHNPTTQKLLHKYTIEGDQVYCLQYDYVSKNRLLTGGRQVCVWDIEKVEAGSLSFSLSACLAWIPSCNFKETYLGVFVMVNRAASHTKRAAQRNC